MASGYPIEEEIAMETIMDTYRSCHIHSLQDIAIGILTGQARQ
jgi:hypothetical protein